MAIILGSVRGLKERVLSHTGITSMVELRLANEIGNVYFLLLGGLWQVKSWPPYNQCVSILHLLRLIRMGPHFILKCCGKVNLHTILYRLSMLPCCILIKFKLHWRIQPSRTNPSAEAEFDWPQNGGRAAFGRHSTSLSPAWRVREGGLHRWHEETQRGCKC
jgi:hypothetical protein